jgi:16S rRNA G966 N2-methylase RsmD
MILWNYSELERQKDLSDIRNTTKYIKNCGSNLIRYYFQSEIIKIKNRRNLSFLDWIEKKENEKPYNQKVYNYHFSKGVTHELSLYHAYQLYGGGGSQSCFKVSIAKWLIHYFRATSVLDFCSGYGGRCLGAMSNDCDYIGYDTNENLKKGYSDLLEFVKPKSKVQIFFEDSSKADFSKHVYDLVLTSPPYFDNKGYAEKYDHMTVFKTRKEFNESFFFPVVKNSFKHLQKNGWLILNIPEAMYEDVKTVLGECRMTFPYSLRMNNKHKNDCENKMYSEKLYCWKN